MNKKIVISLSVIAIVAAIVIGGTIAYFSDTEVSQGNIFTAGSIDLKIDHTRQTYNGVNCETCSVNIWSSSATEVIGGTGAYDGVYPTSAFELTYIHPNWIPSIPDSDAKWIWVTDPVLAADTTNGAEYTFEKRFNWNGSVSNVTLGLALAADNGYKIVFNGATIVDVLGTEHNYNALVDTTAYEAPMLNEVQNGENILEITVRNKPGSSDPAHNPAGLIFDLDIQRADCEKDSEFQQACRLWGWKDLEPGDTFFSFGDIKPGDWGTNVISYRVFDNDAHVCMIIDNTTDTDPSLSGALNFLVWKDDGTGTYDSSKKLHEGVLEADWRAYLGDIAGSTENYIGVFWCAGDIVEGDGLSCNGAGMGNTYQGATMLADLIFYAEQSRHNPYTEGFCDTVDWNEGEPQ